MPLRIDDAIVRVQVDPDSVQQRLDAIRDAESESVRAADKEARENLKKASEEEAKRQKKKDQKSDKRPGRSGLRTGLEIGAVLLLLKNLEPISDVIINFFTGGKASPIVQKAIDAVVKPGISRLQDKIDDGIHEVTSRIESVKPTMEFITATELMGGHTDPEKALQFFNREQMWNFYQSSMRRKGQRAYNRNSAEAINRVINRGVLGR